MGNLNDFENLFVEWGIDRCLYTESDSTKQLLKLVEEMGELASDLARGSDVRDSIGDCLVLLTHIAHFEKTNLTACAHSAWTDIKDRKGKFINGIFVKEEDLKEMGFKV